MTSTANPIFFRASRPGRWLCSLALGAFCLGSQPALADGDSGDEAAEEGAPPKKANPGKKALGWVVMNAPLGWVAATGATLSVLGAAVLWSNSQADFYGLNKLPTMPNLVWRGAQILLIAHAALCGLIAVALFVIPENAKVKDFFTEKATPKPAE